MRILMLLLPLILMACSTASLEKKTNPFAEQDVTPEPETQDELADYARKNHGIMNIHRHGPGFDVLLTLDAGDSDVVFSMAMPAGGETFMPEISDKMRSATTEGDKPQNPAEETAYFNEKTLGIFSDSTKHMLNAQALFYRKDYWKALEETNKAMSLVPKSAQAYALKGSIYYKMGRNKDAQQNWQQALKLDPSLEDVKRSLERIK